MSKVFRRPMFRGGSTNMNGVMSGIEDRENFSEGSRRERLARIAAEYPSQAIDPLSQFLIQGGLNLVSQPSTGGAMEGEILDIEAEDAMALAKIKNQNKDVYSAQLYETQVEKMRDNLVSAAKDRIITKFKGGRADDIARKTTDFVMQAPENIKSNLIEIDYLDVGKGKQTSFVPDLSNVQQGQIFYDATMGQWKKRVSVGSGKLDFVTLDPYNNYQPIDIDQD